MKRDFDRLNSLLEDDRLSHALRRLPARTPPAGLATSLRVLASRERQRAQRRGWKQAFSAWALRTRMWMDHLMRPLAVPFAGGVLSAVALFSIWLVPTYPVHAASNFDVPTTLTTDPTVKRLEAVGLSSSDLIVIDVSVDDSGRMIDYKVVSGTGVLTDAALRHRLENILVLTDFFPATEFGRPTAGKMRLSIVSSSIDVKG
jgi:hypothetical protein